MKKLLFITPELPYPPQSGGKVKSLKLLDALAERYAVTLVSPLKVDDAAHRQAFAERSPCRPAHYIGAWTCRAIGAQPACQLPAPGSDR
jgi:hypothetical protein